MYDQSSSSILLPLIVSLVFYVYLSYALMVMAQKTNTPNAWLAWIPLINIFLMIKIGGKSYWWFLLFLIPLVNIVFTVLLYMAIAERLGKPSWIGVLIIVPFINIFIPGYLAFSKNAAPAAPTTPTTAV